MKFPLIKMRHLHCLMVVAQERSMLKAADLLGLTQPAVSKTIAELEAVVGRSLLDRHPRGVDLTPAGQVLVEHAGASLRSLREGLDAAAGQPHLQQVSVAIGALPTVSGTFLPAAIKHLCQTTPSLHVRVAGGTNAQLMARLRQGELELVFGRLPEPSDMPGLEFEQLLLENLVAAVRPEHPLARLRRVEPSALAAYPFILPAYGTEIRRTVDSYLLAQRIPLPGCVIDTLDSVFGARFVHTSDAIWFLPEGLVHGMVPVRLALLKLNLSGMAGPVGVTTARNAVLSAGAQSLVEAFRISAKTSKRSSTTSSI